MLSYRGKVTSHAFGNPDSLISEMGLQNPKIGNRGWFLVALNSCIAWHGTMV